MDSSSERGPWTSPVFLAAVLIGPAIIGGVAWLFSGSGGGGEKAPPAPKTAAIETLAGTDVLTELTALETANTSAIRWPADKAVFSTSSPDGQLLAVIRLAITSERPGHYEAFAFGPDGKVTAQKPIQAPSAGELVAVGGDIETGLVMAFQSGTEISLFSLGADGEVNWQFDHRFNPANTTTPKLIKTSGGLLALLPGGGTDELTSLLIGDDGYRDWQRQLDPALPGEAMIAQRPDGEIVVALPTEKEGQLQLRMILMNEAGEVRVERSIDKSKNNESMGNMYMAQNGNPIVLFDAFRPRVWQFDSQVRRIGRIRGKHNLGRGQEGPCRVGRLSDAIALVCASDEYIAINAVGLKDREQELVRLHGYGASGGPTGDETAEIVFANGDFTGVAITDPLGLNSRFITIGAKGMALPFFEQVEEEEFSAARRNRNRGTITLADTRVETALRTETDSEPATGEFVDEPTAVGGPLVPAPGDPLIATTRTNYECQIKCAPENVLLAKYPLYSDVTVEPGTSLQSVLTDLEGEADALCQESGGVHLKDEPVACSLARIEDD